MCVCVCKRITVDKTHDTENPNFASFYPGVFYFVVENNLICNSVHRELHFTDNKSLYSLILIIYIYIYIYILALRKKVNRWKVEKKGKKKEEKTTAMIV